MKDECTYIVVNTLFYAQDISNATIDLSTTGFCNSQCRQQIESFFVTCPNTPGISDSRNNILQGK